MVAWAEENLRELFVDFFCFLIFFRRCIAPLLGEVAPSSQLKCFILAHFRFGGFLSVSRLSELWMEVRANFRKK